MGRTDSRDYRWFVLCVPPQKERAIEAILGNEGFATFVPVSREYKFANGVTRAKRRKVEREIPIMPRYVFIGMNERTPGWERVFCFQQWFSDNESEDPDNRRMNARTAPAYYQRQHKISILGVDDKPMQVRHGPLRKFMLRHNAGEFNAPSYHKMMQTHREFEPGDDVVTEDELFRGKVLDIDKAKMTARIFVELFGGTREVDVSLEKLLAAE